MIPFLIFGALMTQFLPITTYLSIDEIDYKNKEENTELIKSEIINKEAAVEMI